MIRPLRRIHHRVFYVLAIIIPLLVMGSIILRPNVPTMPAIGVRSVPDPDVVTLTKPYPGLLSHAIQDFIAGSRLGINLDVPGFQGQSLVYLITSDRDQWMDDATLLGPVSPAFWHWFDLPRDVSNGSWHGIAVYDLARQQTLARVAIEFGNGGSP